MFLFEDYLDKDEKFYNYRTKPFDGVNPFDTTKVGIPFYDEFLTDPDYMEEVKNLRHEIVKMSPRDYFQECAKIFNSTIERQISQTAADDQTFDHLKDVLQIYKKTFPIAFLNYAQNSQEGRHRMYCVGELLGWDKKFPVMVIDWADKEKAEKEANAEKEAKINNIKNDIQDAYDKCVNNIYNDVDELISDMVWYLKFNYFKDEIEINDIDADLIVKVNDVTMGFPLTSFDIKEMPQIFKDDDFNLNIDDLLKGID